MRLWRTWGGSGTSFATLLSTFLVVTFDSRNVQSAHDMQLTEAQRERLLRECELSVLCRPGVAKLRSKAASLEASLKQVCY